MCANILSVAVVGGIGGAFNAALSDNLQLLPVRVRCSLPWTRWAAVRLGFIANVGLGAVVAAALACVAPDAATAPLSTWTSQLPLAIAGAVIGFLAARWATNETDKWLLHAAVCHAAAAPAAHPDVVRAIARAQPFAIFRIAQDLMPRRASHRSARQSQPE
jgi:hypothetical protein